MAHQLIRPLRQWPRLQYHCIFTPTLHHSLSSPSLFSTKAISHLLSFTKPPSLHSNRHFRSYGLRLPNGPAPSHLQETGGEQDSDAKRSRNERKREARRAVPWGMELAAFSTPQIKRILRYSMHIFFEQVDVILKITSKELENWTFMFFQNGFA